MKKKTIFKKIEKYSYFIWLIFLVFFTVFVTYFYDLNKKNQINYLNKSLKNIYLNNLLKKITSELKPRYVFIEYKVKDGDTYENIVNNLDIPKSERKLFLKSVAKNKNIKILKLNQKISFKVDKKNNTKIINFSVEIDKKKNIFFERIKNENKFISKIVEKDLKKSITYKEGNITTSLYNSALKLGIKPNTIVEFARLYGFQVDFQRDIWEK